MKNILFYLFLFISSFVYSQEEELFDYLNESILVNKDVFEHLKKNDTILYELIESIKVKKTSNIERRIDSFILKSYTSKELILALRIDRLLESGNFEFDRNGRFENPLEINTLNGLNNYLKSIQLDVVGNPINFKKNDTIKPKN